MVLDDPVFGQTSLSESPAPRNTKTRRMNTGLLPGTGFAENVHGVFV